MWEWGNSNTAGNEVVTRIFNCMMAVALGLNVVLALFAAFFWINSIGLNSSSDAFYLQSVRVIGHLGILTYIISNLIAVGILLGIYLNLSPNWPELIIAWLIMLAVQIKSTLVTHQYGLATQPLEAYHVPMYQSATVLPPKYICSKQGREELKSLAKHRAQELTRKAYHTRGKISPYNNSSNFEEGKESTTTSSVGALLREAANNLGRNDEDITTYESKLANNWYTEAEQLQCLSVEFLAGLMPHRLATEVHDLVQKV